MKKVTLFLSCVSDEFHKEDKALDPQFVSWRTYLEFQSCALTIREALCGQFPTHLRYQRDLYLSGLRAGRALRNLGQIKAARQHLLRVQEIARALQKTSFRYYKMPSEWTEIQTELALLDAADTPASSPLD